MLPRQGAAQAARVRAKISTTVGFTASRSAVDLAVIEDVDVDIAVPGVAVTGNDQAPAAGDFLQAVDQAPESPPGAPPRLRSLCWASP